MANEVHVYRVRLSQMLLWTVIAPPIVTVTAWLVSVIPMGPSSWNGDMREAFAFVFGLIVFLLSWWLWLIKIPRLEISVRGIRYVGLIATLEAPWRDVRRISVWTTYPQRYRGLIIGNPSYQVHAWVKAVRSFKLRPPELKLEPKIPLEPLFAGDVYSSEIGNEIRQYVPQIFTSSVRLNSGE